MKTTKIIIRIFDEIGGDAAISVSDGDKIYQKIDQALSSKLVVVLDFQNISLIITAFLNACIGQLYSKYSSEELQLLLKVENVSIENKHLFQKVISRAKEYFENPDDFEKSIDKVLGDE